MAHRIYQGKTGVVWNVTKSAVGVLLKKKVGNGYRTDFLQRCKFNMNYAKDHKKDPKKFPKRDLR